MRKIICFLLFAIAFVFAEETEKNPWQVVFDGNKTYSNFQLNEQLEIPDEFGNLDTTKQDFMMGLAIENIRALYYSQGFFSLNMKMEIRREYDSENNRKRVYAISLREGERYHFGGTNIIVPDSSKLNIDKDKLRTNNKERIFSQDDIAEDIQFIQQVYRKAGYLHTYVLPGELIDTTQNPQDIRSSAQGLFMMMTNGFGATIGTLAAGAVVDATVYKAANPSWPKAWFIFAGYAFVVGVLFWILFKDPQKKQKAA